MKKDFSQPFKQNNSRFRLLLQDDATGKFLVLRSIPADESEQDFYAILDCTLKGGTTDIARQLAAFLYASYGYSLVRFRKLARETSVSYSFIDETPGTQTEEICLHVVADIPNKAAQVIDGNEERLLVDLEALLHCMTVTPFGNRVAMQGIARLLNEQDSIG